MKTTEEWALEIGEQVRGIRVRMNLDQATVAQRAGIALSALKNLEAGKGATLKTLIKTIRVLGRTDWFDSLAPAPTISPMQMLLSKPKRVRQRAYRKRTQELVP